jgi:hypothetical protein
LIVFTGWTFRFLSGILLIVPLPWKRPVKSPVPSAASEMSSPAFYSHEVHAVGVHHRTAEQEHSKTGKFSFLLFDISGIA